jgi:hypothetical protein
MNNEQFTMHVSELKDSSRIGYATHAVIARSVLNDEAISFCDALGEIASQTALAMTLWLRSYER